MLNYTTLRATAALTIAAMLAGCATAPMNPNGVRQDGSYPQGGTQAATDEDPCSVGTSAAAGAAVGALLGALAGGKNGAL